MQNRFLPIALLASSLFIIGLGCTKLDTTTLGTDVLTVDNINTFSQEFPIDATQGIFTNDSTIIRKTDNHVIGRITTDAVFGKTDAAIYVQFKPTFYPFYFGNAGDTVRKTATPPLSFSIKAGFDSAYICLSYKGAWGDTASATNLSQRFEVRKITDLDFKSKPDTGWVLNKSFTTDPTLLGYADIKKQDITQKTVFAFGKDSVENQIRIPLSTSDGLAFMESLFNMDSAVNKGFNSDVNFSDKSFGFEIKVTSPTGNTLYYVNLTEAKTRLDFVYHRTNAGKVDTVVQSFRMYPAATGLASASSTSNYVNRNYAGTSFPAPNTPTDKIYLQTSPGTFGNLKIPGLNAWKDTNRIIHRAYLVIDQVDANPLSKVYTPPPYLYLDLKDTVPGRYKPVYFDLSNNPYNPDATIVNPLYHPYPNANVDLSLFGGVAMQRYEAGNLFYRYEINITRYVQHMVTNGYRNYDLRLYAPFTYYYPQYAGTQYVIPYYNPIAAGRVVVGTGNYLDPNHKMKLVVIYSKVQ